MLEGAVPSVLQVVSVSGYFSAFLNSKCKEVDEFPYMWWGKNNHQREEKPLRQEFSCPRGDSFILHFREKDMIDGGKSGLSLLELEL